ncbi:MAG TPA: hypothetical protein VK761_07815 [Solirubrobacteraceae bacterium]|nr:hypothetical protein [Solirubrobacteraceae bacterium]
MVYIALAAALFLAAFVGLAMCRLAALSDRLQAAALAEWMLASRYGVRPDGFVEQPAFDAPISAYYREAS